MNHIFDASTQYCTNGRAIISHRGFRSAFTLIELLVVVALTAVLATLLFVPLVKGFQYTSTAQTIAAAQDGQRLLLREIERDLGAAAGVRDTQGKYLNIVVLQKNNPNDTTGSQALVHIYNAYTDVVPPRVQCQESTGPCSSAGNAYAVTDPTTRQNVLVKQNSAYVTRPDVVSPIAPASTFTRYFIGLKYPCNLHYTGTGTAVAQPYQNIYDKQWEERSGDGTYSTSDVANGQLNNTYVLYVATVSPYNSNNSINTNLFPTNASGNLVLDDPDFFRIVTTNDYNAITSANYTASDVLAHNKRVYNWWKISHRAITGCEYDLLQYGRTGSDVAWTNASGLAAVNPITSSAYKYVGRYSNGVGTSAPYLIDSLNKVGGGAVLEVRSALSIAPSSVGGESAKLTAVDYSSEGVQESSFLAPGAQYIPTLYNTSMPQLQGSPNIMVDTGDPANIFATRAATSSEVGLALLSGGSVASGDFVETQAPRTSDFTTGTAGSAVYDITAGSVLSTATAYVPFAFNANAGTVNFSIPILPPTGSGLSADPSNSLNPWWNIPLSTTSTYDSTADDVVIDLNNSTLFGSSSPFVSGGSPAYVMVVNSERIKGPDRSSGPAQSVTSSGGSSPVQYPLVAYTRVPYGSTIGVNQYAIEYLHPYSNGSYGPRIHLGALANWPNSLASSDPAATTILLAFNGQNNVIWTNSLPTPANITASYSSGDSMRVVVGLRVFDTSSQDARSISMTAIDRVGNGTR